MHKRFLFLLAALIGLFCSLGAYAQYSVESVPNPKSQGDAYYVSDPDHHLRSDTRAELNTISAGIEAANGSEFAIVIVDDYQGGSDFQFALDLFNHWGIGKQGSENGLLLFLSMDRREYRFISGYGLEGIFPDILLKQIGENYLVPYLKDSDTDKAVLSTAKAVESVFLSPEHKLELSDLQAYQPTFWNRHAQTLERTGYVLALFVLACGWISLARRRILKKQGIKPKRYKYHAFWFALFVFLFFLFISVFPFAFMEIIERVYQLKNLPYFGAVFGMLLLGYHYRGSSEFLKDSTRDKQTGLSMQAALTRLSLLPLLLSPFAYGAYHGLKKNSGLARLRATPPAEPGQWTRLNRDTLKPAELKQYLSDSQRREEKLDVKSYEIWRDTRTGALRLKDFPGQDFDDYTECPQCHGQTLMEPSIEVRERATYSRTGKGERIQSCAFCSYEISLGMVVLPKRTRSSSPGSSGSSGGGGGGGGGSFGGGSSGGGGAGGRW